MVIFRPNDFSLGSLLLELVLFESINKIAMVDATPSKDKSIIALSIFFVRLSLYEVNGKQVPYINRDVYVWSGVLLLTSLVGVSEITKRNIMEQYVPFVFLFLIKDINKPRLDTSEGS